ncbi:unnamed protein product [Linum tenue]|uniref:Uncharacterized protein n=1 Tax=Linum tenue TaxID=586396 RepID=A0AAV0MH69_9ROSI|nr:unnamed protein product [Linum tenue]
MTEMRARNFSSLSLLFRFQPDIDRKPVVGEKASEGSSFSKIDHRNWPLVEWVLNTKFK